MFANVSHLLCTANFYCLKLYKLFLSLQLYVPEQFLYAYVIMCYYIIIIVYFYRNVIYKLLNLLLEQEFQKFWHLLQQTLIFDRD